MNKLDLSKPRNREWLRFAVYFDDELPTVIYKYREQADSFVSRMKNSFGIDYVVRTERWERGSVQ